MPPLFPERRRARTSGDPFAIDSSELTTGGVWARRSRVALVVTGLLLVVTAAVLASGLPGLDSSPYALQPRRSPAYAALDEMQRMLGGPEEPLWLIVTGKSVAEVHRTLDRCQAVLAQSKSNELLSSYVVPVALWPSPNDQEQNRSTAAWLAAERDTLTQTALHEGFATNALTVTQGMLGTWDRAARTPGVFWPTNAISTWVLGKLASHAQDGLFAMGFIYPNPARSSLSVAEALKPKLGDGQVWLSGWGLLGHSVWLRVFGRLWMLVTPMVLLVLTSLWLAFHRKREVLLSLSVLCLSGLCVLTIMRLAGWKWNLMNLMALPLILGTGVDYSIFMQLALKRYHGSLDMAYRSVGRALLLCGGTAIAGFGSLVVSTTAGMASLGRVCALGIAANMLISVFLLPIWWTTVRPARRNLDE